MQTLVHLSDLHLGSQRSLTRARALVGQVSALRNATVTGSSILPPATTPTSFTYTIPNSLRRHLEFAVGLNYWFDPDFVVKCSYHWIDGNRFAVPESPWNNYTTDGNNTAASLPDLTYDAKTQMILVGAQFAF